MSKLLIDEYHARRIGIIRLSECAAAQQWNTRHPQIICSDHHVGSEALLARRQFRFTLDVDWSATETRGGKTRCDGCILNAGYLLQARNKGTNESDLL